MTTLETLRGKHVLVTGGAGFVGANVVRKLLQEGAEVTVLDDFFSGSMKNLPEPSEQLHVIEGSVTEENLVADTMREKPLVIHAAARNIIVSTKNPKEDFETNIGGTLNVLLAARRHGTARVVYTSSASVYGNPRYLPINEDDRINTLSPYSVSKYAGESYCKAFYESYGVSAAAVRYSNVYGRLQRPDNPYCGVISKFFAAAMKGEPIVIHGDGEQTRDYTYVDDAVSATLAVAVSPKADGRVYNVGTGRETSVNLLARAILAQCGSTKEPTFVDRRDIDNIRRRVLNIELPRRDLRWTPAVTLEKGLALTHAWLQGEAKKA